MSVAKTRILSMALACAAATACVAHEDPESVAAVASNCGGGPAELVEAALVEQARQHYEAKDWEALEADFRWFARGAWLKRLRRTADFMNYFLDCGKEPRWIDPRELWVDQSLADAVIDFRRQVVDLARAADHLGMNSAKFDSHGSVTVFSDSRDLSLSLGEFQLEAYGTATIDDGGWVFLDMNYSISDRYDFHPEKGEIVEDSCDVSNGIQEVWLADLALATDSQGDAYACEFEISSSWYEGSAGPLNDTSWVERWSSDIID